MSAARRRAGRAGRLASGSAPAPADVVVPCLFFLSGLAALVLQGVFVRQLTWVFGSATAATAVVLAAYMAGLALGAAAFGSVADRSSRPLALYGWLEIGAGLTGAALAWAGCSHRYGHSREAPCCARPRSCSPSESCSCRPP